MKYVAKALIYNTDRSVLILTRSDTHPRYPLHDDLPGGEIDPHESREAGMLRELQEEIGWSLSPDTLRLAASTQHTDTTTYLLYVITLDSSPAPVTISWEHSAYRWEPQRSMLDISQPDGHDSYFRFCLSYLRDNTKQ